MEEVGGTSDYNDLDNKPQINGHTLSGNSTTSDLGINVPTKTSDLTNDSGFINTELDPTVPNHVKNITSSDITNWNNKSDFSGNYNDLTNKPTIPTKTSELTNDSGFLTSHQDISGKEDNANKVTSIDSSSTDIQYPTAKLLYDQLLLKYNKTDGMIIKELTETTNVWELNDGIYFFNNISLKFKTNYTVTGIGYLYISKLTSTRNAFLLIYSQTSSMTAEVGYVDGAGTVRYGYPILTTSNVINNLNYTSSSNSYALSAYQGYLLNQNKQDKLTAGTNITIDANNVISASGGGGSTYTAGDNIDITNDVISTIGDTIKDYTDSSNIFRVWQAEEGIYKVPDGYSVIYAMSSSFITEGNTIIIVTDANVEDTDCKYAYCISCDYDGWDMLHCGYSVSSSIGIMEELNLNKLETITNKVTSISSSSTNTQYPSAKLLYDQLALKQDTLTAGTNITIDANNVISATGGGGNYNDLTNKPSINSVTLSGDKTNADLGIPTITYGTTDIGTGATLADGTFYFVYE